MRVRFVIAAGQHFAFRSNNRSAPYAETAFGYLLAVIDTIHAEHIPTISLIGWHQRVTMRIVVQLCGLEDQAIGA